MRRHWLFVLSVLVVTAIGTMIVGSAQGRRSEASDSRSLPTATFAARPRLSVETCPTWPGTALMTGSPA
jgi:hypothetical protein